MMPPVDPHVGPLRLAHERNKELECSQEQWQEGTTRAKARGARAAATGPIPLFFGSAVRRSLCTEVVNLLRSLACNSTWRGAVCTTLQESAVALDTLDAVGTAGTVDAVGTAGMKGPRGARGGTGGQRGERGETKKEGDDHTDLSRAAAATVATGALLVMGGATAPHLDLASLCQVVVPGTASHVGGDAGCGDLGKTQKGKGGASIDSSSSSSSSASSTPQEGNIKPEFNEIQPHRAICLPLLVGQTRMRDSHFVFRSCEIMYEYICYTSMA